MRVFLGNSPWQKEGFYGVRAGSRWPHFERCGSGYVPFPFFLAYAAAILEKENQEVLLVDGIAEGITSQQYLQKIINFKPDLVLLEVSTNSFNVDMAIAQDIKKALPGCRLAFCGLHIFMYDTSFLDQNPLVDYVLAGEYEYTLRDLITYLNEGKDLSTCQGLYYRQDGKGVYTGKRPLIANLDELPWPARHFLPMEKYHDNPGGIPDLSLQVHSTRGCPFQCVFCAWPQIMYGDHSYRVRSPKDVVDEIAWCKEKYSIKSFYIDDDTFNIGKPRLLEFAEELKKRNLGLPWAAMARSDTCDAETIAKLRDAGMVAIKYGVESGDQNIVNAIGKKLNLETLKKAVKETKALGVKVHLTFTFGLPGETRETAERTVRLALALDPDSLQFSLTTPYPGSKFYDQLEKSGHLLSKDWDLYDGYNTSVVRTDELGPEDLVNILRDAEKRWSRHRVYRILRGYEFKRFVKGVVQNPRKAGNRLKEFVTQGRL